MNIIMNHYRHLDRSRIQFDFLCFLPCEETYEKEINELGGRVYFISKPGQGIRSIKELMDFFREHGPEYEWLHNHEVYLSFFLYQLSHRYGINNFIIHGHATRYSDCWHAALRNRMLCIPIRFMKCEKAACSLAVARFLYGSQAAESGKVKILYNTVDSGAFRFDERLRKDMRLMLRLNDETLAIGHIGRFTRQKNHEFLLRILLEVQRLKADICLICVGDGPCKENVEKLAQSLGIADKIRFLGSRDDVSSLLNAFDCFVLPSLFEGLPVSLIEACYNGLPCIVSDSITDEIPTGQIQYLPLKSGPINWANQILKMSSRDRDTTFRPLLFDINYQADYLQRIYCGGC